MKFFLLVTIALALTPIAKADTTNELITFKGIPFGKPGVFDDVKKLCMEKADDKNREKACDRSVYNKNLLFFYVDYGNLNNEYMSFLFDEENRLRAVRVMSLAKSLIPEFVSVLESKYGKPTITTKPVENRIGMKFDNTIYTWLDSDGNRIKIESIFKELRYGKLEIESGLDVKTQNQMNEILKESAKTNL